MLRSTNKRQVKVTIKQIKYAILTLLVAVLLVSCQQQSKHYTYKKIGIIKDAEVVATSFNEPQKTQIKTDKLFLVVRGFPQLSIGDSLLARFESYTLESIRDSNGRWHCVY